MRDLPPNNCMWAANAGSANWSTRSLREFGAFKRVKGRIDGFGQAVTGGAGHLFSSPFNMLALLLGL
jgi:hypothetical protein